MRVRKEISRQKIRKGEKDSMKIFEDTSTPLQTC